VRAGLTSDEILFAPLTCSSNSASAGLDKANATGYDRVQSVLQAAGSNRATGPFQTLFGDVAFNDLQRNVEKEAVTTQVVLVRPRLLSVIHS
jgi:hypothetical protein